MAGITGNGGGAKSATLGLVRAPALEWGGRDYASIRMLDSGADAPPGAAGE